MTATMIYQALINVKAQNTIAREAIFANTIPSRCTYSQTVAVQSAQCAVYKKQLLCNQSICLQTTEINCWLQKSADDMFLDSETGAMANISMLYAWIKVITLFVYSLIICLIICFMQCYLLKNVSYSCHGRKISIVFCLS